MPKNNKKKTYQKPTQEQIQYLQGAAEEVDNVTELEVQLCEYFTVAEKGDGSPYSVSSLLAAIRAINRFYNSTISKVRSVNLCDRQAFPDLWAVLDGKTKDLSEKGYGETNGSDALTFEEIRTILIHEATSRDTPNDHFRKRKDGGFDVYIYKSKTNQRGLNNLGSADKISIPAENADAAPDYSSINIWYQKNRLGQLKLKTFLRTLAEKIGINYYEVSTITRHRYLSGIARYERPKDGVQQFALNNLITSIDSSETIASDTQLSLPANTLSARQIFQG
ncbi:8200_t:CDS:2, partial [Gigaspora rosea]